MIRTLLWKEYREQRSTTIALALFAVSLAVLVQLFVEPSDAVSSPYSGIAFALVWLAGLVVGGQAFAGETEGGTLPWLDSQPRTRRSVGRTKIVFSLLVVLVLSTLFLVLGSASGWLRQMREFEFVGLMVIFGLNGLGCGLVGSTIGRSTLSAIGWGIVLQIILPIPIFFMVALVVGWLIGRNEEQFWVITGLMMIPLTLEVASRRFTVVDRTRRRSESLRGSSGGGWRSLWWLTWRQGRAIGGIVIFAGIMAAVLLPIGRVPPIWPAVGLALGIAAGLGAFAADHVNDAARFLGDRRIPMGRVWLTKTAFRLTLASAPVLLQLAAQVAIGLNQDLLIWKPLSRFELEQQNTEHLHWSYPALGPLYGFAIAQFLGIVCRKQAVALVLSVIAGAVALVAWWPSNIIGGLHVLQWIVPPLLLLAMTRWLARPWATGRLSETKIVVANVGVVALAVLLMVAGVAYRTIEVRDRAAPFDVVAFEASLPTPEQNQPMLKLANVLRQFRTEFLDSREPLQLDADGNVKTPWNIAADPNKGAQLDDDPESKRKMNEFAASAFLTELRTALGHATGTRHLSSAAAFGRDYLLVNAGQTLSNLLIRRARQLNDRGQSSEAIEFLETALDLGQVLRQRSNFHGNMIAANIERQALESIKRLSESPNADLEILSRLLARLVKYDRQPSSTTDMLKIDYLSQLQVARNGGYVPATPGADVWNLTRIAASAPWEMSRSIGILNAMTSGYLRTATATYPEVIGFYHRVPFAWSVSIVEIPRSLIRSSIWRDQGSMNGVALTTDMIARVTRRVAILQLALAIYERRNGKPAATLADLVPEVLTEIPIDPYCMRPFAYRVSQGERINWWPDYKDVDPPAHEQPSPGQGVIWSTGGDIQDDGGRVDRASWWGNTQFHPGRDLIFLAPAIKKR